MNEGAYTLTDMVNAPKTRFKAATSLVLWHYFELSDRTIAGVVHHDVKTAEMRLDLGKGLIDLRDGGHIEGENEQLRRRITLSVGCKLFRATKGRDDALIRGEHGIEHSASYALGGTGD